MMSEPNAREIIANEVCFEHGGVCPESVRLTDSILAALEAAGYTVARLEQVYDAGFDKLLAVDAGRTSTLWLHRSHLPDIRYELLYRISRAPSTESEG